MTDRANFYDHRWHDRIGEDFQPTGVLQMHLRPAHEETVFEPRIVVEGTPDRSEVDNLHERSVRITTGAAALDAFQEYLFR